MLIFNYLSCNVFFMNKNEEIHYSLIISGTYLYIESSSPQKPGDKGRLNSATIKGISQDCTVSHQQGRLIPAHVMYHVTC